MFRSRTSLNTLVSSSKYGWSVAHVILEEVGDISVL